MNAPSPVREHRGQRSPLASRLLLLALLAAGTFVVAGTAHAQEDTHASMARWVASGTWGAPHSPVTSDAQIHRVARMLARGGVSQEEIIDRLQRLLELPGTTLYLEITSELPFQVAVQPTRSDRLYIETGGESRRMRGSLSAELRGGDRQVHVLWIDGTVRPEYVIEAPSALTHITLVVNGRVVVAERPVDHQAGRATIFAR